MVLHAALEVEERLQRLGNLVFCNVLYVVNNRVVHRAGHEVEELLQGLGNLVFCSVSYVGNNRVVHSTSRRALATTGNTGR